MGEWGSEHYNGWKAFFKENKHSGTVVAIFGPTASGKSVARDTFVDNGWDKVVSLTTRPPRPGQGEEASEYEFVSKESFDKLYDAGELINVNLSYAGNSYGIAKSKLGRASRTVLITDKTSIPKLKKELKALGKKVITIYVTAPPKELMQRQLRRLQSGEYVSDEQLKRRVAELEKEIEKEYKVKSLADHAIIEKDISQTIARARELATTIE